jgi:hypothetical protein
MFVLYPHESPFDFPKEARRDGVPSANTFIASFPAKTSRHKKELIHMKTNNQSNRSQSTLQAN